MAAPHRPQGLTTRAALLAVVVCALVVSAAVPLREYLSQRSQIRSQVAAQSAQRQRVADLREQLRELHDPAYVKAQAEQRLHYVMPGETTYVLIDPSPSPTPVAPTTQPGGTVTKATGPWWSQVWGTVQQADRPSPAGKK